MYSIHIIYHISDHEIKHTKQIQCWSDQPSLAGIVHMSFLILFLSLSCSPEFLSNFKYFSNLLYWTHLLLLFSSIFLPLIFITYNMYNYYSFKEFNTLNQQSNLSCKDIHILRSIEWHNIIDNSEKSFLSF